MHKHYIATVMTVVAIMTVAAPANAAIIVQFTQVGADVRATATGTFDVTGLDAVFVNKVRFGNSSRVIPGYDYVTFDNGGIGTLYTGLTRPADFGPGGSIYGSVPMGTGSFGLSYGTAGPALTLPTGGYDALAPLNVSAVFAGQTFASMGLTPGSYVFTAPNDSITVQIGPVAVAGVPEPASWAMMIGGFGLVAGAMRRRQRTAIRFA